jgi:hypothetical protein
VPGIADQGTITYLDGTVAAAPGTPAAGKLRVYAKTGKVLAVKDDAGAETVLGSGIADQGAFTFLDATEAAAPATPAAGKVRVYAKSDGRIYSKDDAGVESGPFSAAGGASDPLQLVDDLALHAKGDNFNDATLAAWTLTGIAIPGDVTAVTSEPYDATCLDIKFSAQSDRLLRAIPTPASGDFELYLTIYGFTNSTPSPATARDAMLSLILVDDSGAGSGVSLYTSGIGYLWAVSGHAYSSTVAAIATDWADPAASNMPVVYRVRKVGTTITGYLSFDGGQRYKSQSRTDSTTFTKFGVCRLFSSGGTDPVLRVGRINAVEL